MRERTGCHCSAHPSTASLRGGIRCKTSRRAKLRAKPAGTWENETLKPKGPAACHLGRNVRAAVPAGLLCCAPRERALSEGKHP